MTTLAKLVASVAQVALQNVNRGLIRDLERDSQTLDRIRDSFSRILDKRVLKVWSFEEELAIKGGGKVYVACLYNLSSSLMVIHQVVYGDSAIIGDAREIRGSIHADHLGMVKFASIRDDGYKKVLYAVEMLLEGLDDDQLGSTDQSV
jgi:protein SERAC1